VPPLLLLLAPLPLRLPPLPLRLARVLPRRQPQPRQQAEPLLGLPASCLCGEVLPPVPLPPPLQQRPVLPLVPPAAGRLLLLQVPPQPPRVLPLPPRPPQQLQAGA
jgi:hypothetical protein